MQHKKKHTNNIIIYGKHPVISALKNPNRNLLALYITQSLFVELKPILSKLAIKIEIRTSKELDKLAGNDANHQNIILETLPLINLPIEDVLDQLQLKEYSSLAILDQITDPHNIGAIIRSAAAFAIDAIILPEHNCPKENHIINKCAAGASETIPIIRVNNLVNTIKSIKDYGYWVVGLDGDTSTLLTSKIFSKKTAFILGSESVGMRRLTKENCDYIAKIAISNQVESLNVSNAATIAFYQFADFIAKLSD